MFIGLKPATLLLLCFFLFAFLLEALNYLFYAFRRLLVIAYARRVAYADYYDGAALARAADCFADEFVHLWHRVVYILGHRDNCFCHPDLYDYAVYRHLFRYYYILYHLALRPAAHRKPYSFRDGARLLAFQFLRCVYGYNARDFMLLHQLDYGLILAPPMRRRTFCFHNETVLAFYLHVMKAKVPAPHLGRE